MKNNIYLVNKSQYEINQCDYIVVSESANISKYIFLDRLHPSVAQSGISAEFYLSHLGYKEIPEAEAVLMF